MKPSKERRREALIEDVRKSHGDDVASALETWFEDLDHALALQGIIDKVDVI